MEDFEIFPDWHERYEYVISLGKTLAPMDSNLKTEENIIKGCQAKVWLDAKFENGRVEYSADSDSQITKGLIAIFIRVLNGEKPEDILKANMEFLTRAGLRDHFISTRANALNLMTVKMKQRALEFASHP